jgi:large subunit ribosomal protein L6
MSRIGKMPVKIPAAVQTTVQGDLLTMKGPKGNLQLTLAPGISVSRDGEVLKVVTSRDDAQTNATFGTTRARIAGMVLGVTQGWKKSLELVGVGYGATVKPAGAGQVLTLNVGFSHDVIMNIPKDVKVTVEKTTVHFESADKELLGTVVANVRKVKPPEPYLGKGIKGTTEKIRRKAGKTGKK